MAQIFTHRGGRCLEHPHLGAWGRCSHCSQPFASPALSAGPRAGTAPGAGSAPTAGMHPGGAAARPARGPLLGRTRARYRGRALLGALGAALVAVSAGASMLLAGRLQQPAGGGAGGRSSPARRGRQPPAVSWTRIQSVATIGVPAGERRRRPPQVPLPGGGHRRHRRGNAAAPGQRQQRGPAGLPRGRLRLGLAGPRRQRPGAAPGAPAAGTAYIHRLALWRGPGGPRAAWVREFQVLASPTAGGDDSVPLRLDREPALSAAPARSGSAWCSRPRPGRPASPSRPRSGCATGSLPGRGPARRLLLRLVTTYGPPAPGATGAVAERAPRPSGDGGRGEEGGPWRGRAFGPGPGGTHRRRQRQRRQPGPGSTSSSPGAARPGWGARWP